MLGQAAGGASKKAGLAGDAKAQTAKHNFRRDEREASKYWNADHHGSSRGEEDSLSEGASPSPSRQVQILIKNREHADPDSHRDRAKRSILKSYQAKGPASRAGTIKYKEMGGGDSTLMLGSDQHSMLPETQENYKHMKTLIEQRTVSQQSQNEIIRLKTEIEILNITVRHLQEDLKGKSDTIKAQ